MSYYYGEEAWGCSSDYVRYPDRVQDSYDYRGKYGGSAQDGYDCRSKHGGRAQDGYDYRSTYGGRAHDGYDYRSTYGGRAQGGYDSQGMYEGSTKSRDGHWGRCEGSDQRRAGYSDESNRRRRGEYRDESNGQRRGRRVGGDGGGRDYRGTGNKQCGRRGKSGPGVGTVTGSGYEEIGRALTDRRLRDAWAGRSGAQEVSAEDPRLNQEFLICRRPGFASKDRSVLLDVNYVTVRLEAAPRELFKYHVDVERSPDPEDSTYGPCTEPRPVPQHLVRKVINAALQQYGSEFGDIHVVHDGVAALYSPVKLPWTSKDLVDVGLDGTRAKVVSPPQPASADAAPRRHFRGPPSFVVKLKLVETILTETLLDYCSNPDVNVMPVLQALDVAARHLAAQRLIAVDRNLFSLMDPARLEGGKQLCWGYHQAIHVADKKLVMNVDPVATVFYAPGKLMDIVLAALKARSPSDIRGLTDRDSKILARALRKIEVVPTHREDRKRAIYGVSDRPASETIVSIKGEDMSVADYFNKRYKLELKYPKLPLVNVGSKRAGKETWLPVELCQVAPGQRCTNINDLDTAEIIRHTSKPPNVRKEIIKDKIAKAGFENDPFLAAFGVKVDQRLDTTRAGVIEAPEVQYANVSEKPAGGQWNLRAKCLVEGGTPLLNWGVVILANVGERDVQRFGVNLAETADASGLMVMDKDPLMFHRDKYRDASVEELMTLCFKKLKTRSDGPPQLLMVIKQDKDAASYEEIKRVANEVLGVPSQCIVSQHVPNATPQYRANVCLKMNMKLGGKNSILRDSLPLVSTAPTILIGADIDRPRSGAGQSIAGVVGSMDRYSSKYVARVAAQKGSSAISSLPTMLREIFLEFYRSTKRRPEHIIYYRDGVSEGEYFDVLQAEMRSLRMACLMMEDNYLPPVTFIVVNRRHHARAFPCNSRDADRKGNVLPGTVIDTGIVDNHRFEFFLYGHSGIQGTSVPCHYTVLYDENKMSAEDVQRLTYHLGYTFARCTRSVSVAAPAYNARVAASQARRRVPDSDGGASNLDFTALHDNLNGCMFFI